jgi:YceI-like domain
VDTANRANSSVTVEVEMDSFEVREGTGASSRSPTPTARRSTRPSKRSSTPPSSQPLPSGPDGSAGSFTLDGELTIVGVTRPVTVRCRVTDDRVVGGTTVVQSRWGIRPHSAFFGALKVSDEVKVDFDVALMPDA